MIRRVLLIVILALVLAQPPSRAVAASDPILSPAQVVELDRSRDGEIVTVQGEAIGEHLRAMGGERWVNLLGEDVGLGIWVTDEMAAEIEFFGDYKNTGDTLMVTGPVNMACDLHGGEFDVHAQTVSIIHRGAPRDHEVRVGRGLIGVGGMALGFVLWRTYLRRRNDPEADIHRWR